MKKISIDQKIKFFSKMAFHTEGEILRCKSRTMAKLD